MYMSKQIISHLLSVGLALDYAAHIGVTYVVTKGKSRRERAQASVSRFRSHPSSRSFFFCKKTFYQIDRGMADIYSCFIVWYQHGDSCGSWRCVDPPGFHTRGLQQLLCLSYILQGFLLCLSYILQGFLIFLSYILQGFQIRSIGIYLNWNWPSEKTFFQFPYAS